MTNSFYRAFEDRHRGSRETIKARLGAYLPFLTPLREAMPPTALDLGCGRGEWLELLAENGFVARGVDLDEGMLEACRERNLNVSTADALTSLKAQPDASLSLISAFHLIEHIPFEKVQELVSEALRVLRPGGILLLETPNPENLVVATSGFYMDPSHLRPIPPQLLDFIIEFAGFARWKLVRLQESPQLHSAMSIELINVLNGVSPDYSIVAQKFAEPEVMVPFDAAFAATYGLDLSTLAARYQARQEERFAAAELHSNSLFERILETIGKVQADVDGWSRQNQQQVTEQVRQLAEQICATRMQEIEQRTAVAVQQAEHRAREAEHHIAAIYASTSWRITAPLRAAMMLLRRPLRVVDIARTMTSRNKARALLARLVRNLVRRPKVRAFAMYSLARFPSLEGRLRAFAYKTLQQSPQVVSSASSAPMPDGSAPDSLSRSAQKVYVQLRHCAQNVHKQEK